MKIYSGKRSKKNTVSKFVSTELETGEEIVLDERSTKSPLVLQSDLALVKSILVTPAHKLDMEQFHSHDWAADIYPQSHRIMQLVCANSTVQLCPLSSHPSYQSYITREQIWQWVEGRCWQKRWHDADWRKTFKIMQLVCYLWFSFIQKKKGETQYFPYQHLIIEYHHFPWQQMTESTLSQMPHIFHSFGCI